MRHILTCVLLIVILLTAAACKTAKNSGPGIRPTETAAQEQAGKPLPDYQAEAVSGPTNRYPVESPMPVVIYKTKADYKDKVPVSLSADKKNLLSYPGPRDIFYQDDYAYPVLLHGGYLLDLRGIGPGVAFTQYTYEQYSRFQQAPSQQEIMDHLLDTDPLLELYQCTCILDTAVINALIRSGELKSCTRLK